MLNLSKTKKVDLNYSLIKLLHVIANKDRESLVEGNVLRFI